MFGKDETKRIYIGIRNKISEIKIISGQGVTVEFEKNSESVVLLNKEENAEAYYDIFNGKVYYRPNDLSLIAGEYALTSISKTGTFFKSTNKDILKRICDNLNYELENIKNDQIDKSKFIKNLTKIKKI